MLHSNSCRPPSLFACILPTLFDPAIQYGTDHQGHKDQKEQGHGRQEPLNRLVIVVGTRTVHSKGRGLVFHLGHRHRTPTMLLVECGIDVVLWRALLFSSRRGNCHCRRASLPVFTDSESRWGRGGGEGCLRVFGIRIRSRAVVQIQ